MNAESTGDLFAKSSFDIWRDNLRERTRINKIARQDRSKRFDACVLEINAFVDSKKWSHADYVELHGGIASIWLKHGFTQ